ncbi:hypothetical protein GCM10009839_22340 [Catenulispora yoronensis]|uniref:DUF7144 domain-containing protein n=1 Tax=Catenulispora yoronensis TaxID=450799 RepID=A0ABP5FCX1_9ACTN
MADMRSADDRGDRGDTAARIGTLMAGILMIVLGILAVLQGISAIDGDEVYGPVADYSFRWSQSSWGWIHLVVGVLVLISGFLVFTGSALARMIGIVLASFSVIANFLSLPFHPVWSIALIGIGMFAVWALCQNVGPDR